MHRRIRVLGVSVVGVVCLALAGVAHAAQTAISGSVANGGCDATRTVSVSGASRIEVDVSSTAPTNNVFGEIVAPGGKVVATGSYDTPSGGDYGIRVCSLYEGMNPASIQYTGRYATGPAGQPALPRSQGAVLGATTTLSRDVRGTGAINTRAGLAWFTVKLGQNGMATVKVYNPLAQKHYRFTNAAVTFGTNTVRIAGSGMTLTLVDRGATDRVVFRSLRFKASGTVVRGGYTVL